MGQRELPSRAKPEALQQVCKHVRSQGPIEKQQLYDEMDVDRRQIRASIEYGVKLGFLEMTDEVVSVAENGYTISFADSMDEKFVSEVFRDAIRDYGPYREALMWAHSEDLIEDIKGEACITQSALQKAVEVVTDQEFSPRTINLLIKTAEAAGLGRFVTGRKGLETRLETTGEFESFIQSLIEEFGLPEHSEADSETEGGSEAPTETGNDTEPTKSSPTNSGSLRITAEWDVSDKSEEQIAELITEIRKMGADKLV